MPVSTFREYGVSVAETYLGRFHGLTAMECPARHRQTERICFAADPARTIIGFLWLFFARGHRRRGMQQERTRPEASIQCGGRQSDGTPGSRVAGPLPPRPSPPLNLRRRLHLNHCRLGRRRGNVGSARNGWPLPISVLALLPPRNLWSLSTFAFSRPSVLSPGPLRPRLRQGIPRIPLLGLE